MKKLRAIIAIKTLDFLKINKWDSISIEGIYKRSKITNTDAQSLNSGGAQQLTSSIGQKNKKLRKNSHVKD